MTDIKDGWVLANGVRTHYSYAGDEGPTVVLLHGGGPGSSGYVGWRLAIPVLADAGFRVFAPDQLSMGRTDAREHAWPVLGHQSLVDHVADFVEALCLDTVHLAGNSQGAYVAVKYALDHPERAGRLVLIGSATIAGAMDVPWPGMENIPGLLVLRDYDYSREMMQRFMESVVNDPAKIPVDIVDMRHEMANLPGVRESRAAFDAYQQQMRQHPVLRERYSLVNTLPNSSLDIRFIWGSEDRFAPLEMGLNLQKKLPKVPFDILDAGHQCQTDRPDEVHQILINHFS